MNLPKRISIICAAAAAGVLLGGTTAYADGDGGLLGLGLLDSPSVTLACFPAGQVGQGNTFTGNQNVNCSQSAEQASTPVGQQGFTGYEVVSESYELLPNSLGVPVQANCPVGKKVTGGGIRWNGSSSDVGSHDNGPTENNTGWVAKFFNFGNSTFTVTVYAICANVG
ncbi:hypothetical protein ACFW6V_14260 [Streptomyces sp. NPDC058734]|uniref:hypothetical protein n=1 Tax=Streptomyces sp. NPDC058734 TaxID=3346615 RepID=UPI0036BBEB84